ncbi:Crp/Fnr family transcriptional regulator [Arcobacter sp. FWKO B]|uniref:Crp/Fnr family transcriptional regulator n=1 Tax=Arcobacter sp. FWKO B TaxID=2593672 RepID=UPI001908A02A|nr:Crp/Fnr family transcriptional regulator [Arcobacter sp. FWKO B]
MAISSEYFENHQLFFDLSTEEIDLLAQVTTLKKFYTGNILYYEKDKQDSIYYLASGSLKIYKVDRLDNEIFMYNINKGSLISEITDLDGNIGCFANAEFTKDSEVLVFDYSTFKDIFSTNNKFLLNLIKEFAKKTKMLQCIINREIVFDGTAKVAFMLAHDLESFNSLKKGEIAYMLNIQPETLSRILNKLFRNNYIQNDGQNIKIVDLDGLKSCYE